MVRQNVEHRQAVFEPAPGSNLVAQDELFPVIVGAWIEEKLACICAKPLS